jgi:hypothetical protein
MKTKELIKRARYARTNRWMTGLIMVATGKNHCFR